MLCGSSLYVCDKHRRTSDSRNARKSGGVGAIGSAAAQPSPAHTRPVTTCRRVCIGLAIVVLILRVENKVGRCDRRGAAWPCLASLACRTSGRAVPWPFIGTLACRLAVGAIHLMFCFVFYTPISSHSPSSCHVTKRERDCVCVPRCWAYRVGSP